LLLGVQVPNLQGCRGSDEEHEPQTAERIKNLRLVEMRSQAEGELGARFVPDAVVVAGRDLERVISRGNVGVIGAAPLAGLSPTVIEPLQLIAKQNLFRGLKVSNLMPSNRARPSYVPIQR